MTGQRKTLRKEDFRTCFRKGPKEGRSVSEVRRKVLMGTKVITMCLLRNFLKMETFTVFLSHLI